MILTNRYRIEMSTSKTLSVRPSDAGLELDNARLRAACLREVPMRSAAEVREASGLSPKNASEPASRWLAVIHLLSPRQGDRRQDARASCGPLQLGLPGELDCGVDRHPRPEAEPAEDVSDVRAVRGLRLLPVYRCGNNARRTRPEAEQRRDWKRVKAAPDQSKPDIVDHQRGFDGA